MLKTKAASSSGTLDLPLFLFVMQDGFLLRSLLFGINSDGAGWLAGWL